MLDTLYHFYFVYHYTIYVVFRTQKNIHCLNISLEKDEGQKLFKQIDIWTFSIITIRRNFRGYNYYGRFT